MINIKRHHFNIPIRIFNVGDLHRGDYACDVALWHKIRNEIANSPDTYWLSTGDLLNMATKNSITGPYKSMSPAEELKIFCEEAAPIAHKCLGFVGSNHHRRVDKEVGLSVDKFIAEKLNIPFLGHLGLLNIVCGRASYYIGMHHGAGGGKMRGGKTNNLQRLANIIPGADIYLEGHTHTFNYFIDEIGYIDRKRILFRSHPVHFVTTGHFLNYWDSYAAAAKFAPSPKGAALLTLGAAGSGNLQNKEVRVELFQ